jgi:hypothetical protein
LLGNNKRHASFTGHEILLVYFCVIAGKVVQTRSGNDTEHLPTAQYVSVKISQAADDVPRLSSFAEQNIKKKL